MKFGKEWASEFRESRRNVSVTFVGVGSEFLSALRYICCAIWMKFVALGMNVML
jgi:hypothetical protein